MTEYQILRANEETGEWTEFAQRKASSASRAIAAAAPTAGGYVAIPLRSWQPLTVKVEQTTKTTIG